MKYIYLFTVGLLLFSTNSFAIVHHCDYLPFLWTEDIHEGHEGKGCDNTDSTETPREGHCDHENSYFWTDMDCTEHGCQVRGTIDCGPAGQAGNKYYSFDCWGSNGSAFGGRYSSGCLAQDPTSGEPVVHSCACDYCQ